MKKKMKKKKKKKKQKENDYEQRGDLIKANKIKMNRNGMEPNTIREN